MPLTVVSAIGNSQSDKSRRSGWLKLRNPKVVRNVSS
jgi:hypothetical protein